MFADGFSQRADAVVGRVLGLAFFDGPDRGLAEALGRDEVRLADPQRDDALGSRDQIEKAPDPARRDTLDLRVRERTTSGSHAPFSFGRSRCSGVAGSYVAQAGQLGRS